MSAPVCRRAYSLVTSCADVHASVCSLSIDKSDKVQGTAMDDPPAALSGDMLTDLLIAVFDECSQPHLKKEKNISEFINTCKNWVR